MSKIYADGHVYESATDVPDLGSLVCVSADANGQRNYEGLAADVSKLPKYADLETGSSFFAVDSGAFYKYEKSTQTWYEL